VVAAINGPYSTCRLLAKPAIATVAGCALSLLVNVVANNRSFQIARLWMIASAA
jgi:hypothetical protein